MTGRPRDKLPKWTQELLFKLERDVEYLTRKLEVGPENSDTFADPHGSRRPLGAGTAIEFVLGPDKYDKVKVRVEKGHLEVYGSQSLLVCPRSSNTLEIRTEGL